MASSSSSSSSSSNSPCAACKFLRRKCMQGCIFAPYFPPEEPQKFANVHKIFGASNVTKLLNELLPHQREDAVNSLAYEAEARMKDPVYGCVGAISFLQREVHRLQKELDAANAELIRYACNEINSTTLNTPPPPPVVLPAGSGHHNFVMPPMLPRQSRPTPMRIDHNEGVSFFPVSYSGLLLPYPPPQWNDNNPSGDDVHDQRGGSTGGGGGAGGGGGGGGGVNML